MRASTDNRKQVKEWYSLQDIAELFGRSTRFARSLMDKGMPYVRLGGIIRVSRKEFWRWLLHWEQTTLHSFFLHATLCRYNTFLMIICQISQGVFGH